MINLYVVHDDEGTEVASFYAENGLHPLQIQEFYLGIDDENNQLDIQKKLVAQRRLFLAIIDKKQIKHSTGLNVSVLQQGDHCLVLYDDYGYSRSLSFVDVINQADQFIIKDFLTDEAEKKGDDDGRNLLLSILAEIKRLNNHTRLWSIEDIEHYFQMGRTSVTKKIISNKDFPKPITINKTLPRWKPEEVKQWAEKQRH